MRGKQAKQDRVFFGTIAIVMAVLFLLFVFGRGPGSLVWLAGGAAPRWLPFAGSGVYWSPFAEPNPLPVAAVQTKPSPVPPSAAPAPLAAPPSPVAKPPSPKPAPKPSPRPSPIPSPIPSPSPKPSPSPSPVQSTLFTDNFEEDAVSSSVPRWSESSGGWSVAQDGSHVLATDSGGAVISAGSTSWTNYKVTATVKVLNSSGYGRVLARYQSAQYFYACGLDGNGTLFLGKTYGGTWYTFATTPFSVSPSAFYAISFTVNGNSLTCSVTDPVSGHSATVTSNQSYFANGSIGAAASGGAEFDNFAVVTLG